MLIILAHPLSRLQFQSLFGQLKTFHDRAIDIDANLAILTVRHEHEHSQHNHPHLNYASRHTSTRGGRLCGETHGYRAPTMRQLLANRSEVGRLCAIPDVPLHVYQIYRTT